MDNKKKLPVSGDLIQGAFGKYKHDIYLAYDELTDEMIIRVIEPSKLAYVYELENNDRFALLVEAESSEIIGFQLFNFTVNHLPLSNWSNLKNDWNNVLTYFREHGYRKMMYDPNHVEKKQEEVLESASIYRQEVEKCYA